MTTEHRYHAASLAELAELFEAMANGSGSHIWSTTKQRAHLEGQRHAWRAAAAILRGTVLTANGNERV